MIYRLSAAYLSRLESERNVKLFYGYVIASAISAASIWQLGAPAAFIGVAAFVAVGVYHWKLNQLHVRNMAAAQHVEVEILADRLVYRSAVGEQRINLDQLRSVEQASKFEPIKLRLADAPPLMLDGLQDADKLAQELAAHVR